MPRVFHWNLENFYGTNIERNVSFAEALRDVPEADRLDIVVAGFTEVRADHETAQANLHDIAEALNPGGDPERALELRLIDVGTLAGGRREFVGIAWRPYAFEARFAGVVMPGAGADLHRVLFAEPDETGYRIPHGADVDGDVRGIAFVAGAVHGVPYSFGFMHNVYVNKDRRAFNSQLMPSLANSMKSALNDRGFDADQIIIGGDFNVEPPVRHSPYPSHRSLYVRAPLEPVAAGGDGEVPMDIAFARTTAVHTYDYFYVSDDRVPPDAATAYADTRQEDREDRSRPDHTAISLYFEPLPLAGELP